MDASCPHCRSPVPANCREAPWCCRGCREVASLLAEEGLGRFYELAGNDVLPARVAGERSFGWLEPLLANAGAGPVWTLELDVQGLHCAACVWLLERLFQRRAGAAGITVNPALGKVRLSWERRFDVAAYLRDVERFGYLFGPARKADGKRSRDLLARLGVCGALEMGVMMFTIPFYLGLAPDDPLFRLFSVLTAVLSGGVVLVGGWPFFKSAVLAVRGRVMHLDLPIALGIVLAFGASLLKFRDGRGDQAYFDGVSSFTTLMLVGRWLQERLIDRNRRFLLEDGGADGLSTRRMVADRLEIVPVPQVRAGDRLVLAPGDLVPVDAALESESAEISTDWINGESAPRVVTNGVVPAGAFNAGRTAMRVRASTDFAASPLPKLLGAASQARPAGRLVDVVSRWYVPAVLVSAALGCALWWHAGTARALDVTVALLVVTCPCALGIAVPLAWELALTRLRRAAVMVRSPDLLSRVLDVKTVLFDKTGTLTLGRLELVNREALNTLSFQDRNALFDMVSRSNHPVSRCLAAELGNACFSVDSAVVEFPGQGLEMTRDGHTWRLGRTFTKDGVELARFTLREAIRADARTEIAALREAGFEVGLVSGDAEEKVAAAAKALGIPPDRALAGQSPEDKARAVERAGASTTLFVGDGVNDTLAFAAARATASPAVDRPVVPGKADVFLVGESIGGIRTLLTVARELRRIERNVLIVGLAYNVLAVALCLAGLMTPLRAAIAMPVTSLSLIALVTAAFAPRRVPTPVKTLIEVPS